MARGVQREFSVRKSRCEQDRMKVEDIRVLEETDVSERLISLSDFVGVLTGSAASIPHTGLFTQSSLYDAEEWSELPKVLFPRKVKRGNCPALACPASRLEDVVRVMDRCRKLESIRPHIPTMIKKLRGVHVGESEDTAMRLAIEARNEQIVPGVLYAVTSPILMAIKIGKCRERNRRFLRNRYVTSYGPLTVIDEYTTGNINAAEARALLDASKWHLYGELFEKEFAPDIKDIVQNAAKSFPRTNGVS